MAVILDIRDQIKEKLFNECLIELIQSCYNVSPEELYILLEEYYGKQGAMDECELFKQKN